MKKRIFLIGLASSIIFSLVGCGSGASEETNYTTAQDSANLLVQNLVQLPQEAVAEFESANEVELELSLIQAGMNIGPVEFVKALEAWHTVTDECGTFIEINEFHVSETGGDIKLETVADFEKRDAEMVFMFDDDLKIESLTINPKYTLGETMGQAGLNTLLGMGTVFCVLIFISFIISLFKHIPALLGQSKEEPATKAVEEVVVSEVFNEVASDEMTDDLELVAVITAAIAATEGTSTDGFVVRSIRRKKSNKWKA